MSYFADVEKRPLIVDTGNHERFVMDKKALIVNTNSGEPVSVVGQGYELIPFNKVRDDLTQQFARHGLSYNEEHVVDRGGARAISRYRMPDMKVDIGDGDEVEGEVVVYNSYDSSSSLKIMFGGYRMICSNGMVLGKTLAELKAHHTRNVWTPYKQLMNRIGLRVKSFNDVVVPFWNALREYEVAQEAGHKLIDKLIPSKTPPKDKNEWLYWNTPDEHHPELKKVSGNTSIGTRLRDRVHHEWDYPKDQLEEGRNLWTLYNTFTRTLTHHTDSKKPSRVTELQQVVSNQFNRLVRINQDEMYQLLIPVKGE